MKELLIKIKKHDITFILLNIYLVIMIFLPKQYSDLFGLPIRLGITGIYILITLYRIYTKKIALNKNKNKVFICLLIIFLITIIPSLFLTKSLITSIYTIIKFITVFLMLFILSKIKFTKEEYLILLKNLIICLFVISIIGIIQYVFNIDLLIKNSGIEHYPGAKGRLATTFFNTIYYGIFINLVFAFVFYLLNKVNSKKHIIIFSTLCILLYINLIFTFTRSTIIIFIAIIVLMIVLLNKLIFNKRTLIVFLSFLVITFSIPGAQPLIKKSFLDAYKMMGNIVSFLPGIDSDMFNFVDYNEDSEFVDYSLQHREAFAAIAKKIANDNLFTGVGFGTYINYMKSSDFDKAYPEYTLDRTHPHSSLILMFAEIGIFGLLSFCFLLISLLIKTVYMLIQYFKKDNLKFHLASILFAITSGFIMVNIMSENAIYDTQITYIFMILFGLLTSYINFEKNDNVVLFISSTGGHLNELLQLKPLIDKYDSYVITEKTKSNLSLKNKFDNVGYLVYGTKKNLFKYLFVFSFNIIKSLYYYLRIRPDVVVTTGTHTAVPMCYIGKIFGSKIIFIETFANSKTKTVAGKIVYPIADTFIVQWESMLELYPKAIYAGWIY